MGYIYNNCWCLLEILRIMTLLLQDVRLSMVIQLRLDHRLLNILESLLFHTLKVLKLTEIA